LVWTRRGSTRSDGEGDSEGVGSREGIEDFKIAEGISDPAKGSLAFGDSRPVSCLSAFEGVLGTGDSGKFLDSMSQLADLVNRTLLS